MQTWLRTSPDRTTAEMSLVHLFVEKHRKFINSQKKNNQGSRAHSPGLVHNLSQHSSKCAGSRVEREHGHNAPSSCAFVRFYLLMMTAPLYMTEKVGMLTSSRFSPPPPSFSRYTDVPSVARSEPQPSASSHMPVCLRAGSR